MRKFLLVIVGIILASVSFTAPTFAAADDKCAAAITFATTDAGTHLRRPAATCNTVWDIVVTKNCIVNPSTNTVTGPSTTSQIGKTKAATCSPS